MINDANHVHIIDGVPDEDGGVDAVCITCHRTLSKEELEDWNEDEAVRRGDNKSYLN